MAFYGCDFTFNGVSASSKGLMLYDFGGTGQEDVDFSVGEIVEDRINRRYDSLLYGLKQNEPLEFNLTFGAEIEDIDSGSFLTRLEINEIASWLTGHQTWKTLFIHQPDMATKTETVVDGHTVVTWTPIYYYKCMITGLKLLTDGSYPWAFTCHVTCDSPFAYTSPQTYTIAELGGTAQTVTITNPGGYNGFYYPVVTVTGSQSASLSIVNTSDGDRTCAFAGMPTETQDITIDCRNQVITSSKGYNLYQYFNYKFLRLPPGTNILSATGTGALTITCEFPVQIGA